MIPRPNRKRPHDRVRTDLMATELPSANMSNDLPGHFLELAPMPIATVEGAAHLVRYVNPAFCQIIGKSADQLLGRSISELLPERDRCLTLIDQVFRTGRTLNHTETDVSEATSLFWSYTMWPVLAGEERVGVMIQVTEITATHTTTVEMNEALLLGSLRQHELVEEAANLNQLLQIEITERKKAAKALAEKARLLDLTHDAVIVSDLEHRITYWNHGAEEIYGWTSDEVIGKISNILLQTGYPGTKEKLIKELHRTDRWSGELIHTRRDGERVTVLVRKTLDRDSEGNPASVLQNITDITARKQIEAALLEAGEQFQFMAESMPQKIFTAKPDGEMNYLNQQCKEFTGLSLDRLLGWGWVSCIHPDDLEENVRRWKDSLASGKDFELEHRFRRSDGEYRWHLSRAYAMRDPNGQITLWIGSSTDIDDMMKAQEELMDAEIRLAEHADQLEDLVAERTAELTAAHAQLVLEAEERKRLEAAVADAIERERERLGSELHDGLLQELTGIGLMLLVLTKRLEAASPAEANEAARLSQMLERAHGNARDLAKDFYPVELKQHGLLVALAGVASRSQSRTGVHCSVRANRHATATLSEATAVQLYRIAQEAVRNAIKHAHAKQIFIRLGKRKDAWYLTVRDDGIGLAESSSKTSSKSSSKSGGMGLRIMQYRAQIIHGTLRVVNDERGGTLVSCTAPGKRRLKKLARANGPTPFLQGIPPDNFPLPPNICFWTGIGWTSPSAGIDWTSPAGIGAMTAPAGIDVVRYR